MKNITIRTCIKFFFHALGRLIVGFLKVCGWLIIMILKAMVLSIGTKTERQRAEEIAGSYGRSYPNTLDMEEARKQHR